LGNCGNTSNLLAAGTGGGSNGGGDSNGPSITPTTVAAATGWTGTQTLMALIGLLLLVLVLAPGVASRLIVRREE
jgi:hypothetical protein